MLSEQPSIFISYAHGDAALAHDLARRSRVSVPESGHTTFATWSGEAGSRNFSVQNTRDSPLLVTQNCATLVRSVDADQHISACSDESCPGRSSEVGVGGGVATTMQRMSPIEIVSALANRRWSFGTNCIQRCSSESTAVVDPVVEDVGSAVLISTIEVVVPSDARVAVSEDLNAAQNTSADRPALRRCVSTRIPLQDQG